MNSEPNQFSKTMKVFGIIASILMIILGVLVFLKPLFAAQIIMWLFIAGLFIYGSFLIFIFAKAAVKNGWNLASGIMAVTLAILLIFSEPLGRASTFAFMLAFMALSSGINQIGAGIVMKKTGAGKSTWLIVSGIINILLFIFLFIAPLTILMSFGIIAGVFLIFEGIALFAETMSTHTLQ